MRNKIRNTLAVAGSLVGVSAFAEGSYTVPAGVTQAIADSQAAATALADAAIPGVAKIALAFVGITVVWLIVRAIRKGAK